MVCRRHRAFAGPIATAARPAGRAVARSGRRSRAHDPRDGLAPPGRRTMPPAGDRPATGPQWGRALAAAVAAAILGFYFPSLLARSPATEPAARVCDRAAVATSAGPGC